MEKQKINIQKSAILDAHSPIYLRSKKGKFCGGDIGDIYLLVEKASDAGFEYIQFTPIQDTGINPCPYMGLSNFSYNPVYLSLHHLDEKINYKQIDNKLQQQVLSHDLNHVSYGRLYKFKMSVLRNIYDKGSYFNTIKIAKYGHGIVAYAVYKALREKYRCKWYLWPEEFKKANLLDILANNPSLHREIKFFLFVQDVMKKQWLELVKFAQHKGVKFILDKPIYPIHDSADVWANQKLFYINLTGSLQYGSGCDNPNDPFGAQYWGHAVYKFKEKPNEVIKYYCESIKFISQIARTIRLDHTLALIWKYYIIRPDSQKGKHLPAIKHKFFNTLIKEFPNITFIAEDLGYVSSRNVDEPLAKHNIPGMRSLQWFHIPKYAKVNHYPKMCLAMTSNHDLDSLPSWWRKLRIGRKEIFWRQISDSPAKSFQEQVWQIVSLIFKSDAYWASITLRDLTFDMRRYNKPGVKNSQNWTERMPVNIEDMDLGVIKKIIAITRR